MKTLMITLSVLISITASGSIDTIQTKSKITDVSVFFSGAQITRQTDVKAMKGKHFILLDNLPGELDPQSIQVNGIDNCKILLVRHQLVFPSGKKGKEETELENKLDQQEIKVKEIKNRLEVFKMEERLLIDNSSLSKYDRGSLVADIKEAADYYRTRLNEIRQSQLNLFTELENIGKKTQEMYVQLNEITIKKRQTYSQVLITIDCEKDINSVLKMTYYVVSAGWTPTYDFRVDDISKPLNIVYNANVYQSTGESWNNVKIKLTTNNPTLSGQKPELVTWYLGRKSSYEKNTGKMGPATLKGRVFDAETNEPLPSAAVIIEQNNKTIGGVATDIDGQYTIKPIPPGIYTIKAKYIGYEGTEITNISFTSDNTTLQDIKLKPDVAELSEVVITKHKKRLIDADNTTTGGTYEAKEIAKLPTRSVNSMVHSNNWYNDNDPQARLKAMRDSDAGLTFKGNRESSNQIFINGVKRIDSDLETINNISNSLITNITNLEYSIDIPYSIASDGQDNTIKIKDVFLPVSYIYHVVPKLDNDVFLTADIHNWEELNLLSGKSNIYYQGTYTGETFIDADQTTDTMSVSLGRDKNIIVERQLNKEVFERRFVGFNVKEFVGFTITTKNNKGSRAKIIIEDQFPVSEKKSIEVERLEFAEAKLDEKTGKLTWEFELDPYEKKTVSYKYSVKYPKELMLALE